MRLTRGFCDRFGGFAVRVVLSRILHRVIGRPVVVTLATATSSSTTGALGLLTFLIAVSVLCAAVSSLLLRVGYVVTLGLTISAIATVVPVVSAAAVALTVVIAVFAIVTLSVTRAVAGSSAILLTLAATIALTLF